MESTVSSIFSAHGLLTSQLEALPFSSFRKYSNPSRRRLEDVGGVLGQHRSYSLLQIVLGLCSKKKINCKILVSYNRTLGKTSTRRISKNAFRALN